MIDWAGMNNTLVAIRDRRNSLMADLRENLKSRKTIRDQLAAANAALEQAIGDLAGEAGQARTPADLPAPAPAPAIQTRETLRDRRREDIEARAAHALTAAGGTMANRDLASLLGVSPHGLEALLRGSTRVQKVHDGRIGNEVTTWVLQK